MRIALFPGTFDPITLGHTNIINRALPLFDKIVIGVGANSSKQPMFSIEQRINWVKEVYKDNAKIEVHSYQGLTVDYCNTIHANFILRGIRNMSDFEFEKSISDMNGILNPLVETIFLACSPLYSSYSSTIVRDVIKNKGNHALFLPSEVSIKINL